MGGVGAPGIGCGLLQSSCGNITISGATTVVTATKGEFAWYSVGGFCRIVTIKDGATVNGVQYNEEHTGEIE